MPSILIAASGSKTQRLLIRALERLGWDVWLAATAEQLILFLRGEAVDIVVLAFEFLSRESSDSLHEILHQAVFRRGVPCIHLPEEVASVRGDSKNGLGVRKSTVMNAMVVALCKSMRPSVGFKSNAAICEEVPVPILRRLSNPWKLEDGF